MRFRSRISDSDARGPAVGEPGRTPPLSSRRIWLFRLGAVGFSIVLLAGMEGACVLFDWGRPQLQEDPFVGFTDIHPLFVLDDAGKNYEIPKPRRRYFAPDSFPAEKGTNTFRIFCLGGSTVQGRPYSKETSFTTWLRLSLQAAEPARTWEVINCGGISYASYRLIPILKECLAYQPDLFIICTGHNEFLEDRTYRQIKDTPKFVAETYRLLSSFRSYNVYRAGVAKLLGRTPRANAAQRPLLKDEVDALLDHRGGLEAYQRDESWRAGVIAHYRYNLRTLIGLAHNASVPVILMRPSSNLRDCPPFKSLHRDDLAAQRLEEWEASFKDAQAHYRDDLEHSIARLKRCLAIDDRFALAYYELGKCYEAVRRLDLARPAFLQAREQDICPLRMIEPLERAMLEVARETGTPFVDAHALLEAECADHILGDQMLVDHIHPSIRGHQLIADALADELVRQGWVAPRADWVSQRRTAYDAHLKSLPNIYFLRGQRTLESLRNWTQGRADGPPLEKRHSAERGMR